MSFTQGITSLFTTVLRKHICINQYYQQSYTFTPLYQFYAYWWALAPSKRPNLQWVGFPLPFFWHIDRNKASPWHVLFFRLLHFNHYHGATAAVGQGPFIIEDSWSHSDTPHSVRLLWTSDQLVAETSTWQRTTLTTDKHPCPWRDSNPQSQQAGSCRYRLRLHGHWEWRILIIQWNKVRVNNM